MRKYVKDSIMMTVGIVAVAHGRKSMCLSVSSYNIPIASGALAPPRNVVIPPIMHPQARERKIALPNLLSSVFNLNVLVISRITGKSIAATACSDIQQEKNAEKKRVANISVLGFLPAIFNIRREILFASPERISAELSINEPRIKNTASFPKIE